MRAARSNFLDWTPKRSSQNRWEEAEGLVTVHLTHRGFYARIAQTFFRRPRTSRIALDSYGSFVFRSIDGQRTVEEVAQLLREEFGSEVEPLYGRLVTYLQILRNNHFIEYLKMPKKPNTRSN